LRVRTSNFEVRRAAAPLYPLGASLRKGLRYDGTVSDDQQAIRQRFSSALDALVAHVRKDRSILAVLLCGSLSHDVVWEKSDIDLMFVTVDDKHIKSSDLPIDADGVNVHAALVPRAEFRKMVDGSLQHSFIHSFLSKGGCCHAVSSPRCAAPADVASGLELLFRRPLMRWRLSTKRGSGL
jgi:hypothetical protein